jgi:4-hydroxybenzoate polyprenyltransferase
MKKLLKLIRWDDWYDSKLPLFFLAYYYLLLIHHEVHLQNLILLLPLGIFFSSLASFGYMLNDYSDKFVDRMSGKENTMCLLTNWQQILSLIIVLLIGLIAFIPFYHYKFTIFLLFLSYLSSILYSASPLRLKEKGMWGIACVSLAQRVFPLLIVFAIFEHFRFDTFVFAILSFLIGTRWILVHQILDRDKDMQANVETFAVSGSLIRTYDMMLFLFVIEVISAVALVGIITYTAAPFMLPLLIAYFLYVLYIYPFWKKLGFKRMLSSYDFAPLADFYFFWLPFWMSILLGCQNSWFFVIAGIEILWKVKYIKFDIGLIKLRRKYT